MCEAAKKTSAISFSQFEAEVEFTVNREENDVSNIELLSNLAHATQAISFSETAAHVGSSSTALTFAYLDTNDFCNTMSENRSEAEMTLFEFTCGTNATIDTGVPAGVGGTSGAYSVAYAGSRGSAVSAAFLGGAMSTSVGGKDIERFKTAVVTGAKSFSGTGSTAISDTFAGAFSHSVAATEDFEEVCLNWVTGYCAGISDTGLALLICNADIVEVCSNVCALVGASAESFGVAYADAASLAVAKSELTVGFEVCFAKDAGSSAELNLDLLGKDVVS